VAVYGKWAGLFPNFIIAVCNFTDCVAFVAIFLETAFLPVSDFFSIAIVLVPCDFDFELTYVLAVFVPNIIFGWLIESRSLLSPVPTRYANGEA
jgi:hypothetical protein